MSRADLDKDPHAVATMFDQLAERYDVLNDVLSLGQDRVWRRTLSGELAAVSGEFVLDLAAGTGTSSESFARDGAQVIACDFSLGMLEVGACRRGGASKSRVTCVAGDALRLPFADRTFDAVTISFGLRNVADIDDALGELLRVTKPGGRLIVCEFSHLRSRILDVLYSRYLLAGIPLIARRLTPNPEAYEYLPESIMAWPDQPALAAHLEGSGWERVAWRNLTFGSVALHRGYRPAD